MLNFKRGSIIRGSWGFSHSSFADDRAPGKLIAQMQAFNLLEKIPCSLLRYPALSKLKPIWREDNLSLGSKVKMVRSLAISKFLYACES